MWWARIGSAWSGFDHPAWVLLGAVLDFWLGDPVWNYHPLRLIAVGAERFKQALGRRSRGWGTVWALAVVLGTFAAMTAILVLADAVSVWLFRAAIVLFTFWGFSARNLLVGTLAIYQRLVLGQADESRRDLARIAGPAVNVRALSARDVVRRTVESVANNLGQHIVAPLFFAMLGGPPFLWAYRALYALEWVVQEEPISSPYRRSTERIRSVARILPDRITGWAICAIAATEGRYRRTREVIRENRSGYAIRSLFPEAALAGALGVRIGGPRLDDGVVALVRPLGRMERMMEPTLILRAVSLMIRVTVLVGLVGGILLVVLTGHWI